MLAAQAGHAQIAQRLLKAQAAPDLRNTLGQTALMLATGGGHNDLVKLLLANGAKTNLRNNSARLRPI